MVNINGGRVGHHGDLLRRHPADCYTVNRSGDWKSREGATTVSAAPAARAFSSFLGTAEAQIVSGGGVQDG